VEEFKYLGITLTDKNFIPKEIKKIEVRECLLSCGAEPFLLSKNLKNKIYRTIIQLYKT